jgi:Tol biopolymer transport system component
MSYARITTAIVLIATGAASASAEGFGPWGDPQRVDAIDTDAAEGCPIEAPDSLSLYFASNRAATGAQGKQDIWRVQRATAQLPWGAAENLGPPVNTPEFDYCPTPLAGGALLFVSSQQTTDDCYPGDVPPPPPTGGPSAGDIFATQEDPAHVWSVPVNLGCYPQGPNTPGAEFSPSRVQTAEGTFLFFSSNGYPDSQGQDIYMSQVLDDGSVTAGVRVAELSTPADDRMPNVRADGLEIVFSSNRSGGTAFDQDIYVATRADTGSSWSAPQRIDTPAINTTASETRASLSEDGTRLYFGRKVDIDDPGDVFVATRARAAPTGAVYPTPTLGAPMLAVLAALLAGVAWLARGIARTPGRWR